jgi:hypothetical protein
MDKNKLPEKILQTNPGGQQGHGQLKSRWINRVEEDLRKLGFRNWLAAAQDRGRWQQLLEGFQVPPRAVELLLLMMAKDI